MNDIIFTLGQGGLGQQAPGQDYISGYLIYSNTVPSGFTNSVVKSILSVAQAEGYGISNTYADETAANAVLTVGATGSIGDTININIAVPSVNGTVTDTISYIRKSSDTTTTLLASSLTNAINAASYGFSSTSTGATVSLIAAPGYGASLNSGSPISITTVGSASASVFSQFTDGANSIQAIWHYQISEYFRLCPTGQLYVGFFPTSDTTYASIQSMQSQASGTIRQLMVNVASTTTSSMLVDLALIQTQCVILQGLQTPLSVLYANNLFTTSDLSTLPNLRSQLSNYVSVVIGADQGGQGGFLSLTQQKEISEIGACLGTIALSNVDEDIAWTKFNISNGVEDEVVGFMNGNIWSSTNINLYNQLNNYGYVFLRKFPNVNGSYWNDSNVSISITNDYSYIENNRVIGKAQRGAYADLFPLLNGPVYFNTDGTIANTTIATYEGAVMPSLLAMKNNGEISNFSVTVDTTSDVQATGILDIVVNIQKVGIARNINVKLGYKKTI